MLSSVLKRGIQKAAAARGYRVVPRARDAQTLRQWLCKQPISVVVDVGASTGMTVREWLKKIPSASIYAIEPLPNSFDELKKLRTENPRRLQVYNFAVGRERRAAQFHVHRKHNTSSSILERTDFYPEAIPGTKEIDIIEVEMTTLDTLFADLEVEVGEILLKLDVQGVERDVIAGASSFLKRVRYVLTEISLAPIYVGQSSFNSLHAALSEAGFEFSGFLEQFHLDDDTPIYADVLYTNMKR